MRAWFLLVLIAGCAEAEDDTGLKITADGGADTAVVDSAAPSDTATMPGDTSTEDAVVDTGPCKLVINEVQTGDGSSGGADFVELHNSCDSAKSIGSYKLVYRSGSGTTDSVVFTFGSGASVPAKGYLVVGGSAFTGSKDGTLTSGLNNTGASVGLRDASDGLVDAVGYGTGTGVLVEGTAAPAPGDSTPPKSIARTPNGADSDNNATDFKVATPTPGAAN